MKQFFRCIFLSLFLLLGKQSLMAQQPKTKVTLGIKPGYFYSDKDGGVLVKDVLEDKAAQKAGIKANDVIMAFDQTKIKGIFHYRDLLQEYNSGDKVKVTVKRNKQLLYFTVQFE